MLRYFLHPLQHIGKRAKGHVQQHGRNGPENQHGRRGLKPGGYLERDKQPRQAEPKRQQRQGAEANGQGQPGPQQRANFFVAVGGVVLGHIPNIDIGHAKSTHPDITDDEKAGGPDAIFFHGNIMQNERRQRDAGGKIKYPP